MTREEAIRDLRDKARYPLNTYVEAAAFVDSILKGGEGEIYLLIECDLHHGETRITNLGQFTEDRSALRAAREKIQIGFDNWPKTVKIRNGIMIDIETGEAISQDSTLSIHSD